MEARPAAPRADLKAIWLASALVCFLVVVLASLALRGQKAPPQVREAVREWLARESGAGAVVALTSFEDRPGYKGYVVRVEYTINGVPSSRSPRYFLVRRELINHWEVTYEIGEKEFSSRGE